MKKYLYLLFVALFATMSFSLTSCGDDDEPTNGNIVGSWQMIDGVADAMDGRQYAQFKEDGTYYDVSVYSDEWASLIGGKCFVTKGSWSLEGSNLKISTKSTTIKVKSISSNEMTIEELGMTGKLKRVSDDIVNNYIQLAIEEGNLE